MRDIRRQTDHQELLDLLTMSHRDDNPKGKDVYANRPHIFPTLREALCFAAMLGFHLGDRVKLEGETMGIKADTFQSEPDSETLVWILGVAETKGTEILKPERDSEMVSIFEEYANAGLIEMRDWLKATADDPYGDEAILEGMRRHGFMEAKPSHIDIGDLDLQF